MKTLPLHEAFYLLKQCNGLLLEGRYIEPLLSEIEEDYESEFLILEWEDIQDNQEAIVQVSFREGDNQNVGFNGKSTLYLTNTDGEEEELTLLKEWQPYS